LLSFFMKKVILKLRFKIVPSDCEAGFARIAKQSAGA
jgi:hypothetical protein